MADADFEDIFGGGGGGLNGFWPSQQQIRPSIEVGSDSIFVSSVGRTHQPTRIIESYDTVSRALNWSVGRNDISGVSNLLGLALDSVNQRAWVVYTGQTATTNLFLAYVDLTNGNVTNPGSLTMPNNVSSNYSETVVGRVDAANSRVHWVGIRDSVAAYYVIQNFDGSSFSVNPMRFSGLLRQSSDWNGIYVTQDFSKALVSSGFDYNLNPGFVLGVADLTALEVSGEVEIISSVNCPGISVPFYGYDGFAVSASEDGGVLINPGDIAKYSDSALSQAVADLATSIGFAP